MNTISEIILAIRDEVFEQLETRQPSIVVTKGESRITGTVRIPKSFHNSKTQVISPLFTIKFEPELIWFCDDNSFGFKDDHFEYADPECFEKLYNKVRDICTYNERTGI